MSPISLGIVEPVVLSPSLYASNITVDRHVVTFRMERKLQAIRSDAKDVGFELVVGFLVLGAPAGVSAIGFRVGGAAVGTGVAGAFVIGTVVGGAPKIGEEICEDAGAPEIGTGVRGAVVGSVVVGATVLGAVLGNVKEELLAADGCRTTSTTTTTTAPRDTHANKILPKKIHRYTGRWYRFVLTSGTSNPSGTALGS